MRIIPILSTLIIVIGCFLPWIQLGALFTNPGIYNSDGAIMLITAVIAGGFAFENYSKDKAINTWIYIAVGILGLFIACIDLSEVISRARKAAEDLGKLNSFFGGNNDISSVNFIGSGLYVVLVGSVGLILSGLDIFIERSEPLTKKCPVCAEIIKKEATVCHYCQNKFLEEGIIMDSIETEVGLKKRVDETELIELNKMISVERKKILGGRVTIEIQSCLDNLFTTKERAIELLKIYRAKNKTDLIDDLKGINSSYDAIRRNVSNFIDLDIIEPDFPHSRKS